MALELKEYLGCSASEEHSQAPFSIKESMNAFTTISKKSLMVDIEGIHVGPTRNYTWYTEQALRGSIPTWTQPYERPLILHHNETDGKTIGRVVGASYTDINTRSKTGALIFNCNVADEDGIKGVKDGRLKTVSIGVIANDVRCSICGEQIELDSNGWPVCGHGKGDEYDNEICYWMIYSMEAKELSYVIVPSDKYAHNIKIYSPSNFTRDLTETNSNEGELAMTINKVIETKEANVIVEDAEKEVKAAVVSTEEQSNKDTDTSKEAIVAELEKVVTDLKVEVAKFKKENEELEQLKKSAEEDLVVANKELKEFAVDKIVALREGLGRTTVLTESLMSRSKDSLMDSITDLKEELGLNKKKNVNLTESTVIDTDVEPKQETEKQEEIIQTQKSVSTIEKPLTESLIDAEKDSSIVQEEEKKSSLDVKESDELSNTDYDKMLENLSSFYNL